ncbi:MAG: hypothetical protein ABSB76_08180 [Streptosporangiaceae bacterium]
MRIGLSAGDRTGLVNRVVPAQDLMASSIAMAALICANSPAGVQLSKRALQANMEISAYAAALELVFTAEVGTPW